eukprot:superscaffoldBa00004520_g19026
MQGLQFIHCKSFWKTEVMFKLEQKGISQRGDPDLSVQDHDDSGMEENQNQNPEHRTDNPVKREKSDSTSATTDKHFMTS